MAVKFIDLTNDLSSSLTVEYQRSSERKYLAYFEPGDDEYFVLRNCGLTMGTRHPSDVQQVLHTLKANSLGLATWDGDNSLCRMWEIQASYGTWNPAERGDPSKAGDPLQMPPRWRMEAQLVPEPVWVDVNADDPKPILNAAGDPFDPGVERDSYITILTVRRNEANPDFPTLLGLSGAINKDPWNGYDAQWVRLQPVAVPELEYSQEAQKYYYPMVYVFEINPKSWKRRVLNAGYRQLTSAGKLTMILDDSGQPLQAPGLLDADGKYLKPPVPQDQVLYAEFDIHPQADFSALEFDDLFTPPPVL